METPFRLKPLSKQIISILFISVFLSQQLHAALFTVSNTGDSGAGSLRQAIADSNAAGAPNTIIWTSGLGGSIGLGSPLDFIDAGTTIDVSGAQSLVSINGAVVIPLNDGIVTFVNDVTSTCTITSIIGGPGALEKSGAGDLILTGANTYSGGTILSAGTLTVSNDANLGDTSGRVIFSGGTLKITSAFSSDRNITLNAGGGTIDTNTHDLSLSGVISGSGGLTKQGGGTLNLSGLNVYSGGTTVSSGTLHILADNALPTAGDLTVSNHADFELDTHKQTLNYFDTTAAGNTNIYLYQTPTITVTNNAALGGTLNVKLTPQVILEGQTFTPITYGGTLTGQFSDIVSPAALKFNPTYDTVGKKVTLTASFVPFADVAVTDNQRAVGRGLEPTRVNPTGDLATVMGNLYTLDARQLQISLDQISPIALTSMRGLGIIESEVQSLAIAKRSDVLADGTSSDDFSAPRPSGGSALSATDSFSYTDTSPIVKSPWGIFMSGVGTRARQQASELPGFLLYSGGVIMGADYRGENFAAGVLGGYLDGRSSVVHSSGTYKTALDNGLVSKQSARYGVYGAAYRDNFHMVAYAGMTADSFTTNRGIGFGDILRTASGKTRGTGMNLFTNASYDFDTNGWGTLSPIAALNYDEFRIRSFTENGADSLDLNVRSQTPKSIRSSLGPQYSGKYVAGSYILSGYISAGWRHEFKDPSAMEAQLASGDGNPFSVVGNNLGKNSLLTGIGVAVKWRNQLALNLDYSSDFSSDISRQAVNLGAHVRF